MPGIDLATGNPPDPSHWPSLKVDVSDLISDGGGPGVHPLGLDSLRAALADCHNRDGLVTDASQVHVTSGAPGHRPRRGRLRQPGASRWPWRRPTTRAYSTSSTPSGRSAHSRWRPTLPGYGRSHCNEPW